MNPKGTRKAVWAIGLLVGLMSAGPLHALTDEEVFRDFQFNFINPGARALGLGGAFIAAADDATAAEANPAALHYINRIELFGEFRSTRVATQEFTANQSVGDDVLGSGNLPFLDLQSATDVDDQNVPSFMSFAYPFRIGSTRATVAFSSQVVLETNSFLRGDGNALSVALIELPWVNRDGPGGQPAVEQYTIDNTTIGGLSAELTNYNAGVSFSLGSDLSVGATTTLANLDVRSNLSSGAQDPLGLLSTENPRVDLDSDGLLDDVARTSSINDSDTAFGYTFGIHYHPDSMFESGFSPVRVGAVYRKGAELSVRQTSTIDTGGTPSTKTFENTLRVPDRYGIGVSGELGRNWVFALDLERIEYSDLLENFQSGENFFTSGLIDVEDLLPDAPEPVFDVDDATVVHLGAEYNLITQGRWNYAFRAGYFNAPDNRIRMTSFSDCGVMPTQECLDVNDLFLDAFSGGKDENHYTAGFSFTAPVGLQVQFAADLSDVADQYLVSTIWRIGKVRR